VAQFINDLIKTPKDKEGKIKPFEDYNERVATTLPQ